LCEQFFSFNYNQVFYKSLLNIKQVGSTEKYTNLFYQLISRVDLNKNKQQKTIKISNHLLIEQLEDKQLIFIKKKMPLKHSTSFARQEHLELRV
jgi:hypothetical protein